MASITVWKGLDPAQEEEEDDRAIRVGREYQAVVPKAILYPIGTGTEYVVVVVVVVVVAGTVPNFIYFLKSVGRNPCVFFVGACVSHNMQSHQV